MIEIEQLLAPFKFLKLKEFIFCPNSNVLTVVILYADGYKIEEKEKLETNIKTIINENCKIKFEYKKAYIDADYLKKLTASFVGGKYGFIALEMEEGDIEISTEDNTNYEINLHLPSHTIGFLDAKNPLQEFLEELEKNYFENFEVIIHEKKNYVSKIDGIDASSRMKEYIENTNAEKYSVNKLQKVVNIEGYIGKPIFTKPTKLQFATPSQEYVSFAGVIDWLSKKEFTKKGKDGAADEVKPFFTFVLKNQSHRVNCVFFTNTSTLPKFEKLVNGEEVICGGIYEEYNGRSSLKVRDVSFCKLVNSSQDDVKEIVYKCAPKNYSVIFPKEIKNIIQVEIGQKEVEINKQLIGKSFVVFDIETTGLSWNGGDRIIEIGAVKIVDGLVVEEFQTLINPQVPIPKEASDINKITDDMVKDMPTIQEVLPDFCKFCQGSILVAHNGDSFDMPFVNFVAKELLYDFTKHQTLDTITLARQKIKGQRSYALSALCKHFNISLNGAHRAINDVNATVKLLFKLMEM
ncbi:MAG: exonuclease domain-containing protein [Firmicutes bacterium]|nr:exonuclease domain-containing protein [Bacillota bacterium]